MIWVHLPYATFGLVVRLVNGQHIITEAAPIAAWTRGKPAREVWDYYQARGAELRWLPHDYGAE